MPGMAFDDDGMDGLSDVMRTALLRPASGSPAMRLFDKARRRLLAQCSDRAPLTTSAEPKVQLACTFNTLEHASRALPPGGSRELPGALVVLFDFYAKLQTPQAQMAQKALTYAEIQHCNERLSFFEMLCFCRDSRIVPDLVPKQTLDYVWKLSTLKRSGRGAPTSHTTTSLKDVGLDLEEFIHVLLRVALVGFAEAALGQPRLAISKFAAFLNLGSVGHAKLFVRTTGRETQRRVNFRSAGELERGGGLHLLEERRVHQKSKKQAPSGSEDYVTADQLARVRTQAKASDLTSNAASNQLSIVQEVCLAQYDRTMADDLRPFCVAQETHAWRVFDDAGGLDFGELEQGKRYTARLEIQNVSQNILALTSFSKRGNISESVKTTFDPLPFAPGLARVIDVTLTPAAKGGEFVGSLDVEIGGHSGAPVSLGVPVYYRCRSG
ncbi:hypothetical protein M885DRAFT_538627 [Pelagophyceae sp. CCMP2097]|nr:hypothetical protein M885DRAFT_538627 [Pelagophyceae sp. CCMP2097]